MNYRGYHFYVGEMELPYAPSELTMKFGTRNETVELIDGKEINILQNPKLTEIEFDVELPRGRQYPFANELVEPDIFLEYFEKICVNKTPIHLVITRPNPFLRGQKFSSKKKFISGTRLNDFYSNDIVVSLEDYSTKESAENAYDVIVSLKFKQYVEYGTVRGIVTHTEDVKGEVLDTPKASTSKPASETAKSESYTVKSGDNLWAIARSKYGSGKDYILIYNANKDVIESTAKKYGKKSSYKGSTPGWWIYPGTKLTIPAKK